MLCSYSVGRHIIETTFNMLCTNDVNWLLKITRGYSEYASLEKLNKIVTLIFQRLPVIQLLSYVENKFQVTT